MIDHTTRTGRIHGPVSASSLHLWEQLRDLRDHFLARMVLASDMADADTATSRLAVLRGPRLQKIVEEGIARFERPPPGLRLTRGDYREMNTIYRLLIHLLGYRSLRQFQRACEDNGDTPPCLWG